MYVPGVMFLKRYLFDCDMYKERDELEEAVESILDREGKSIGVVDIKVLAGNIEGISKEARSELVGALLNYIKCTKRRDFFFCNFVKGP